MSEIRLVRCPKCDKVLPEPPHVAVYQCGAYSALLPSKKSTIDGGLSEGSVVNSDKGSEGKEGVSGSMEGSFDQEGTFDLASRSPARSTFRDGIGSKSPMTELDGFDREGDSPESSVTERFLSDYDSVPDLSYRSRNASRLPMGEKEMIGFYSDGVGKSPVSARNASKYPLREVGSRTAVSVRTRHASRSPMRDMNGVSKSLMSLTNGDMPNLPMRGDIISKFSEDVEVEERTATDGSFGVEDEARNRKLWRPDHEHTGQSNVNYPHRRRSWRDRLGDGVDQISEGRESICGSEPGMPSEGSNHSMDDLIHGVDSNKEMMHRDLRFRADNFGGYANARGSIDQWVPGRGGVGADGASNNHSDPIYGYGDQRHNFVSRRGPASVQDLELERAQLLRKYKELKDQLSGLDNNRLYTPGLYSGLDDYSEDESWRSGPESLRHFGKPPHFNPVPVHNMGDLYNYHPSQCDDLFSGQTVRWPQSTQRHQFLKHSVPRHVPGRSLDFDQDSLKPFDNIIPRHIPGRSLDFDHDSVKSYPNEAHYHHHACSCSLCSIKDWQSNSLEDGISVNSAANRMSSHSMNHERHVPWVYNPRLAQTNPRERRSHLAHGHPRRTLVTTLNKQLCHPIAGGAPIFSCCKCFRLLKLPGKRMQNQLQCGACSAIMSFDFENRSFHLLPSHQKLNSFGSNGGLVKVLKGLGRKHRREMTATSTNIGSYDFDAAGSSFQYVDSEPSIVSKGQRLSSSSADNMHRLSSSSSHNSRSSKEDCTSDTSSVRSSRPANAEKPLINLTRPPTGSRLEEHFDYSNCFRKLEAEGKINNAREEQKVLKQDTSLEGSSTNAAIVREVEVHSHETSSTAGTGEFEEEKAGNAKDKHSSIAALVKWGFASKSRRPSPGRIEVYVNGQPIPHRGVKKAEKFAGPIQPGEYWYDSKAGFWGVMGHRCLGIVPPSIHEFSFPIPENCSGGDTAIYVNGRELHKRDLDLLASRGLPTTHNKRYVIDISGKVVEEGTREFVVNLGKLAPTVERNRCGYGMQVPEKIDN